MTIPTTPEPPITGRELWRRYRLVAILAVAGGLLAFVASFVVPASYRASTLILLRGRESTLLTGNGSDLAGQPGVIDSSLAATLSETQGSVLSSRALAESVVDRLDLDAPKPTGSGPVSWAKRAFARVYKQTRAMVTFGFYKEAEPRERAVREVMEGLSAAQVGDSFVLEVTATYDEPGTAAAIANAAAELTVEGSGARAREEAVAHRDFLSGQVDLAVAAEGEAANAVGTYKFEHGISDVGRELELSAETKQALRHQLAEVRGEMDAALAEARSLRASLARIPAVDANSQSIATGRSSTEISSTTPNASYQQTLVAAQQAEADAAGLRARRDAVQATLDGNLGVSEPLTEQEAQLRQLELQHQVAASTVTELSDRHRAAVLAASEVRQELTRLDEAAPPVYPVAPIRYLYLGLGLVLGAVGGFLLSELRMRRMRYLDLTGPVDPTADVGPEELVDLDVSGDGEAARVAAPSNGNDRAAVP